MNQKLKSTLSVILSDLGIDPERIDSLPVADSDQNNSEEKGPCLFVDVAAKGEAQPIEASVSSIKRSAQERLSEDGCLLVYSSRPVDKTTLARIRNALWPEFHVPAVYALERARPIVQYVLGGRQRTLKGGDAETDGAVCAAVPRAKAMHPDAVIKKFDTNAPGWNHDPGAPSYGHFRWMRRIVAQCARQLSGRRVLDAGCGAGWVGIEAARMGGKVSSFDPSPEMVRNASQNARDQGVELELKVGFTESPPFQERFDIVISAGVISFSPDHAQFLDGLDSVLEPGGTVVIADLNPRSLGMRYRRSRHPVLPIRELNALSREQVMKELRLRGYRIRERRHYQLTLPVPHLMHLSETRFNGRGCAFLLWLNKVAHFIDGALGSWTGMFFDSYIIRAQKPGSAPTK